jgi:hypothetical protein
MIKLQQMLKPYRPALVAHACNPNYSGGKDQEDCSLKPAKARPYLEKNPSHKKGWQSGLRYRP